MGKALIIKDADFSANAIEGINLSGVRQLTPENALGEYLKRMGVQNNQVSFYTTGNCGYKIFKIEAHEILVLPKQSGYYSIFFADSFNTTANVDINPAFDDCIWLATDYTDASSVELATHSLCIKGDKEYYIYVQYSGTLSPSNNTEISFPTILKATHEYSSNRTFTQDNYDSSLYKSYPNSATWGGASTPTDGKPTVMNFNVQKGETIHIKANSQKSTNYRLIPQSCPKTGLPSATSVAAGESVEIAVTGNGLAISIYRGEGSTTDKFPEELSTYQTPITE